jgi:ABC-type nitrate/sulfonate/bicarbonate transport system permease component
MKKFLPPLIPLVVITLALEWMVRSAFVPGYLVPAPSAVIRALFDSRDELSAAMAKTSAAAVIGFALSTFTGVAIALLLSSSRAIHRSFYP